jgi:hypothetical protein
MPNITINFQEAAVATIQSGSRGIVALILKDTVLTNTAITMNSINDMPSTLSAYNQDQITKTFLGNVNPPQQVIAYIEPSTETDYSAGMTYFQTVKWDYLAVPGIDSTDATTVGNWIINLRNTMNIKVKAILPNTALNNEGIINLCTTSFIVGTTTYATQDYCARIAGLIAGTPLTMSCTYAVLPEVTDIQPHLTTTQFAAAVTAGELVLVNDGVKCKIYEGVNSLTTTTVEKGADYQKIKLVDIMDKVYSDLMMTIADNYVGKYPDDYNYKCMLILAIQAYFTGLESSQLLDTGSTIGIDIAAQTAYLNSINYVMPTGTTVANMTQQQIKEANTGNTVFLAASVALLDAMENFVFNIAI